MLRERLASGPALERKLQQAELAGALPRVVVPVHLAGSSCDMAAIGSLAERYGFAVLEDASHAIGGRYRGEPVGNCCYSSITVFSFHPVKIITTGEGGLATTNDPVLAQRMAELRSHGIVRERERFERPAAGPWVYEQQQLGFNYRMTDLQAALGLSQLERLDDIVFDEFDIRVRKFGGSCIACRNEIVEQHDPGGFPQDLGVQGSKDFGKVAAQKSAPAR